MMRYNEELDNQIEFVYTADLETLLRTDLGAFLTPTLVTVIHRLIKEIIELKSAIQPASLAQ